MELEEKHDYQSSVDTSQPFRSVKEAVAVFGQRILVGSAYVSPARDTNSWKLSPSPSCIEKTTPIQKNYNIAEALKKVEAELEETKAELKMLKEREQETKVEVAAITAKLRRNISSEEERERELRKRMEKNTTLAQILSLGENDFVTMSDRFEMRSSLTMNNNKKLKPILPLIGDFFPWKKKSNTNSVQDSLYNSPSTQLYH